MQNIRLVNVKKSYGEEAVLEKLNLTIPAGQFFALLGPSGCGKTTLLRLIAGFEEVEGGRIFLGDHEITHTPINERRINTVFQNYALFPHLNVFANVAYGLSVKGVASNIIEHKVVKVLKAVGLERQMYRMPRQLSGGQKQRVALARAIVNEPAVLLLDEPLAALDLKLREKMLLELIDLQSELRTTFVYVTHDQFEALTVADSMAIMNQDGEIEQVGTPKDIYEFPRSSFVAKFVGSTNIFKGIVRSENAEKKFEIPGLGLFALAVPTDATWAVDGNKLFISIRPEKVMISKTTMEGFSNHLQGQVESIVYHGRSTQYNVRLDNTMLVRVFEQNEEHFPQEVIDYDDKVHLYWQKENAVALEQ